MLPVHPPRPWARRCCMAGVDGASVTEAVVSGAVAQVALYRMSIEGVAHIRPAVLSAGVSADIGRLDLGGGRCSVVRLGVWPEGRAWLGGEGRVRGPNLTRRIRSGLVRSSSPQMSGGLAKRSTVELERPCSVEHRIKLRAGHERPQSSTSCRKRKDFCVFLIPPSPSAASYDLAERSLLRDKRLWLCFGVHRLLQFCPSRATP